MQKQNMGATLLLLTASLVAGPVVADGKEDRQAVRSQAAAQARQERAERMAKELELTDAQRSEIADIMSESRARAGEIRRETMEEREATREELLALRNETRNRVNEVLTEEQRERLATLREEHPHRDRGERRRH